ncbi:hypothetical protein D9M71_484660 [compost metagenome]
MQGLVGDRGTRADQATTADDVGAALLAEVLPAEAAGLAVLAVVGGDAQARKDEALGLANFGTGAVQVNLLDGADAQADLPVHQALIFRHCGRLAGEQVVAVTQ